jgi:hypothetical protein
MSVGLLVETVQGIDYREKVEKVTEKVVGHDLPLF